MTKDTVLGCTRHPVSAAYRTLTDEEWKSLLDSIREKGYQKTFFAPIAITKDKEVIDGWHRLLACFELDIEPVFEEFEGTAAEIAGLALRRNQTGRQLSPQELADMAVAVFRSVGLDYAARGRPAKTDEKSAHVSTFSGEGPSAITAKSVADATDGRISVATARRAIDRAKVKEGRKKPSVSRKTAPDDIPPLPPIPPMKPKKAETVQASETPENKPKSPMIQIRKSDLIAIQDENANLRFDLSNARAALKGDKKALEERISGLVSENRALKSRLNEVMTELADAQKRVASQTRKISRLTKANEKESSQ